MKAVSSIIAVACICLMVSSASAEGWGDFKGQITFDGNPPAPAELVAKGAGVANAEICSVNPVVSDRLVIDPKTKGIKNCVIWLDKGRSDKVHPNYAKPKKAAVKIDNKSCVFVPHIVVCRTDQVLNAVNSDNCSHNVKSNFIKNKNDNPVLTPKDTKGVNFSFTTSEILPMPVECNIHSWMRAYCHVLDHPYFAISDKDGKFEIKKLPEGRHKFILWHEKCGFLERSLRVTIKDGKTEEQKLSFEAKKFED